MSLSFLSDQCDLKKRALVRVDLNIPFKDGQILDDTRLKKIKETVDFLQKKNAKILLLSHFGRPKGQYKEENSLKFLIDPLEKLFQQKVIFLPRLVTNECLPCIEICEMIEQLSDGSIALFENTRFYPQEEKNDPLFAKAIATYGEIYVNDAFSASHRAHATTDKITDFLPSYVGFALRQEIENLERFLENPEKPTIAIVGGAKISTKIPLFEKITEKIDNLVIGGGMANSFLAMQGVEMGRSLYEAEAFPLIERILKKAQERNCNLILPVDVVVAERFEKNSPFQICAFDEIPKDGMILDIGPLSIKNIEKAISQCKTLLWNGPLGAFEIEPFDQATCQVGKYIAKSVQDNNLLAIAGGGDTIAAIKKAKIFEKLSYVSTGGGAFLEWLEGKILPGVAALRY